jgi:glycosyltransferase involved in cell wall biosynthesis
MLSITYFYREPRKTGVSIEGIFKLVKESLKDKVEIKEFYCDAKLSRLQNTRRAGRSASDINHITGDVNFLALGLKGKKNILTIHDLGHYDTLKKRNFYKYAVYKLFWFKYPLKYIDIVTVVSQFTKSKLMEYFNFPEDRIRIIHDPVKPVFQFVKKERLNATPVILMMGTGKHKNLDNLIEAANGTGFHIDIIGWPAKDELERLNSYGISHTIYNDLTDDEVYKRYIECDILFNASFYEGFGMPIIEAQSVGRAVITSNIGAMKEVAGNTAVLVDPGKPVEIRNAIMKLVNDKACYDEMVELGRENIVTYQHQLIAQQYLDVYEELSQKSKIKS